MCGGIVHTITICSAGVFFWVWTPVLHLQPPGLQSARISEEPYFRVIDIVPMSIASCSGSVLFSYCLLCVGYGTNEANSAN